MDICGLANSVLELYCLEVIIDFRLVRNREHFIWPLGAQNDENDITI
jgi:hypothetical protein